MTREEAIKYLSEEQKKTEEVVALTERDFGVSESVWHTEYEAFNLAISALREQEQKRYNNHDVACIIAELFGDDCACNFNGIDEWLPMKCELLDACPNTVGVACWEQYLKHKEDT